MNWREKPPTTRYADLSLDEKHMLYYNTFTLARTPTPREDRAALDHLARLVKMDLFICGVDDQDFEPWMGDLTIATAVPA